MSGVATCLMFAVLLSVQPPDVTGDESALPKYDEAPAPVAELAPGTPKPLTPEQALYTRRIGTGISVAGGVFLAAGVAGLIVGITGLAANSTHFGSSATTDFFERQRRAEQRELVGLVVGVPCSAIGVAFSIVGAALRAQARSAPKLQVSIVPTWLPGGGGIAVGGRF
jgi:hypothetical protein